MSGFHLCSTVSLLGSVKFGQCMGRTSILTQRGKLTSETVNWAPYSPSFGGSCMDSWEKEAFPVCNCGKSLELSRTQHVLVLKGLCGVRCDTVIKLYICWFIKVHWPVLVKDVYFTLVCFGNTHLLFRILVCSYLHTFRILKVYWTIL